MKRLIFALLSLSLLIMFSVPTFAVDQKSVAKENVNQMPAADKARYVGDVQAVEMPESVKKIQEKALQIPANSREGEI